MTEMNQSQADGIWLQLKGQAKQIWGELTDDDFAKLAGSKDRLFGLIQERFGDTKEMITKKLESLTKS